jgi:isoquinoline 1-oxidoreductase beta subunit
MYGNLTFENGKPSIKNYDTYRMIRNAEAPEIDVHFVDSGFDPTGLGEPSLPPVGGAIANAIYKATGKRMYKQPFVQHTDILG